MDNILKVGENPCSIWGAEANQNRRGQKKELADNSTCFRARADNILKVGENLCSIWGAEANQNRRGWKKELAEENRK